MAARTVRHGAFREQAPTPFSPSNAASKTCVGPVSSNGWLVALQPPDQKTCNAPLQKELDGRRAEPSRVGKSEPPICDERFGSAASGSIRA